MVLMNDVMVRVAEEAHHHHRPLIAVRAEPVESVFGTVVLLFSKAAKAANTTVKGGGNR